MTQYGLKKEKDFEHLSYTLKNYELISLYIRPCFTNDKSKIEIVERITNKDFNFVKDKGLTFLIKNKPIITFPLKWYPKGFFIEYLDEKGIPSWNEFYHPMDPGLPPVHSTLLRNDIDHMLVEIEFKGKINLEIDSIMNSVDYYWKILPPNPNQ